MIAATHIRTGKIKARLTAAGIPFSIVKWMKDEKCYICEWWDIETWEGLPGSLNGYEERFFPLNVTFRDTGVVMADWRSAEEFHCICMWVKFTLPR